MLAMCCDLAAMMRRMSMQALPLECQHATTNGCPAPLAHNSPPAGESASGHNLAVAQMFHCCFQVCSAQRQLHARPQCRRPSRSGCGMRCAANSTQQEAAAPRRQAGSDVMSSAENDDVYDIVAAARRKTAASATAAADSAPQPGPLSSFFAKCAAAYRIFFPPQQRNLSPKELGRNRLRMILVADRCSMNASSLSDMKCASLHLNSGCLARLRQGTCHASCSCTCHSVKA